MSASIIFENILNNILSFSMIVISVWIYQFTGYITIIILKFIINMISNILQIITKCYYENTEKCNKYLLDFTYVLVGFSIFKAYDLYVNYYKSNYYYFW